MTNASIDGFHCVVSGCEISIYLSDGGLRVSLNEDQCVEHPDMFSQNVECGVDLPREQAIALRDYLNKHFGDNK
jgi:hypothetical protein